MFECIDCFFFQAEDGIRDTSVTGVQTCALPICLYTGCATRFTRSAPLHSLSPMPPGAAAAAPPGSRPPPRPARQIGRASCRERAKTAERAVELDKKTDVTTLGQSQQHHTDIPTY